MVVEKAPDIDKIVRSVLKQNLFPYIDASRIVCMRSRKATSRARARIWSFPHIWQLALNKPAHYIIEILSQHFDHLPNDDKIRVIIHELMHIPKNFSGALIPHHGIHKRITNHTVEQIFKLYQSDKSDK
jgi:predicted metallopeptidase